MQLITTIRFIPLFLVNSLCHSAQFEKLSVAQTSNTTTVTLRAYIPTGLVQPKLTNCTVIGTSLNCNMKAQKPEAGISQISTPVPHILSVTIPQRTDIWQVNIYYRDKIYKTNG